MKTVKESPVKAPKNPGIFELSAGKTSREGMDNLEYLQKLVRVELLFVFNFIKVNTLTETISENHLQIENQKQINRELGKRVHELEGLKNAGKSL